MTKTERCSTFSIDICFRFTISRGRERPILSCTERVNAVKQRLSSFDVKHILDAPELKNISKVVAIETSGDGHFRVATSPDGPGKRFLYVITNGCSQLEYTLNYIDTRSTNNEKLLDGNSLLTNGLMMVYPFPEDITKETLYTALKKATRESLSVTLWLDDGLWFLTSYEQMLLAYIDGIGFMGPGNVGINPYPLAKNRLTPVSHIFQRVFHLRFPGGKMPAYWTEKQRAQVALSLVSMENER